MSFTLLCDSCNLEPATFMGWCDDCADRAILGGFGTPHVRRGWEQSAAIRFAEWFQAIAALAVLLFAACSPPPYGDVVRVDRAAIAAPLPWAFACEFPPALRPAPRAAFAYWSAAAGRTLFEEQPCISAGQGITGVLVQLADSTRVDGAAEDPFTMGFTFPSFADGAVLGASITYYPEWAASDLGSQTSSARHEVGHVLGFGHAAEPTCIMYPQSTPGEELCPAETAAVATLYAGAP